MLIDTDLKNFVVFSEDSLQNALKKINANKLRTVFCVSAKGRLEGVLTDGDVRRWITSTLKIDTDIAAITAANKDYFSMPAGAAISEIEQNFSDRIQIIPLLDELHHLVSFARPGKPKIQIGKFSISIDEPAFIIAEIGNNHNGSLEFAKKLIDEAKLAGADCAKFQLRNMESLYINSGDANDLSEDLGAQYTLDLLAKFQLSPEDMIQAFEYCKEKDILPLCTPWDVESLNLLEGYGMLAYKVASADLTNHDLIGALAKTGKPLICSTGMSSEAEIIEAVSYLKKCKARYVLLHCNSTYPAPFKDVNLKYLVRLQQVGECVVGYSGHERGGDICIGAVALGAKVIEKHFTLDRSMEGNDHRVSMLPKEFSLMVQGIRDLEQALGTNEARRITQGEMMNREVLAKSLVASGRISQGETILAQMVEVKSPGKGLAPYRKTDLIGKVATRDFLPGDHFFESDLKNELIKPRLYRFNRPFGVPVRYHDFKKMAPLSNFDLFEFHLSYKDMEVSVKEQMSGLRFDLDLVVHSPELFSGDHVLDLCSKDTAYRNKSINELQKVIDLTRELKPYFTNAKRPMIIVNAGGFSEDGPIEVLKKPGMYEMVANAFDSLDKDGVELIIQTMPPFPWHFGGQRFHNLFMTSDDIISFCKKYEYRICLDISHSQLACNHFSESFQEFIQRVAPFTGHLHVVDARGVDDEGLQIGDGIVDFRMVEETLSRYQKEKIPFIPEIWQGHKNNGEGFWIALDRLENFF